MRRNIFFRECPSRIAVLVALFISFYVSSSAIAGPFDLPPLDRDDQKLSFLLEVRRQVPALFSNAAQYDIDLFTLLDNEQELIKKLKQYPEYEKLFAQKHFVDLTVTPPSEGISVGAVEIKPEAVEAWRESLVDQIKKLTSEMGAAVPRGFSPPHTPIDLRAKIVEILKLRRFPVDPNSMLQKIGKVAHVGKSKEDKAAFQAQIAALLPKNKILFECQREKVLLAKYECIQHRYHELVGLPHLPSASELLTQIEALQAQEKFHSMLELFAVMNRFPESEMPATWESFSEQIKNLSAEDLIYLNDRDDALKPILVHALGENSAEAIPAVEAVHKEIQAFASQTATHQTKVTTPVKITEVQPEVAIFRGCAGGDCASRYSFPYPNDPHERVFFIGEPPKGYVSATEVKLANGDKGLYVITISGNRVSPGDAELVLRGLEKEKHRLGVQHILLPTADNIAALINYPAIQGVYGSYVKNGRPESFTYRDLAIRQAIEEFQPESGYNQGEYDHHGRNSMGIIFKPDRQSDRLATQVTQHGAKRLSTPGNAQDSTQELLEFILDLHHSKRNIIKARVMQIGAVQKKLDPEQLNSFLALVDTCTEKNGNPGTVQDFKALLRSKLKAFGIREDFIKTHSRFLYPGIAQCTDAYAEENIEETAEGIAQDFKGTNYERLRGVRLSMISPGHLISLHATPAFQKIVNKLISRLQDSDSNIRRRAIFGLSRIKTSEARVYHVLIAALNDPDDSVRVTAIYALGDMSPPSVEAQRALANALKDPIAHVRKAAVLTLGNFKSRDPKVLLALIDTLKDSESEVRVEAVLSLGEIKPTDVKAHLALADALKDPDGEVRKSAAWVLGQLKSTELMVRVALMETLKDPDVFIRMAASHALQEITAVTAKTQQAQISSCLLKANSAPLKDVQIQELQEIMKRVSE
jgi:hypothetical protein